LDLTKHIEAEVFRLIARAAGELGYPAWVVGGYVRDSILGRLCKDIDISCVGSGIELAHKTALLGGYKAPTIFKNFGTAMLKAGEWEIEFVGARKESYRSDSRKPLVEDGSLEDDQNRRDFTINAMAISLNADNNGILIDPFNGMEDLRTCTIRTPLDANLTFSDDPLRMMRAVRFACQLGFVLHPTLEEALKTNKDRILIISQERIAAELNKIILSETPSKGFIILYSSGLLDIILPELTLLAGVETIHDKSHKDNFFHTLKVLDNVAMRSDNLWLRWAAILHDIAKPRTKRFHAGSGWTFHGHEHVGAKMVKGIFSRLHLPLNDSMKYVEKLVLLHLRPLSLIDGIVTDSAVRRLLFDAGDTIDDLMTLCEADITSKNRTKVIRHLENIRMVKEKLAEIEEKDKMRNWHPPVSGEDIMLTFNIKPSKEVGIIKNTIREAIIEGLIPNSRQQALELMKKEGVKLGLKIEREIE
jgi:poly(A) polymerase